MLDPSGGNLLLRTRKRAIRFSEHGERASCPRAKEREFIIEAFIIAPFSSLSSINQDCSGGLTPIVTDKFSFAVENDVDSSLNSGQSAVHKRDEARDFRGKGIAVHVDHKPTASALP